MKYAFGTSGTAASRLESIAEFFNPLAAALVRQYTDESATTAVDLGCGPGFTTDMLAHATDCPKVYGLDNSQEFLAAAKERFPRYTFLEHDATHTPFPVTADIMYVRFLLSHLPGVIELVNAWSAQLANGGTLVIEEVEAVESEVEVFRTYLSVNEAIVASQKARLFVGGELARGSYDARVLLNDCAVLPVADSQAATWFFPNTQTIWKDNECVSERLTPAEAEEVSGELARIVDSGTKSSNVTWKMRRLVLRRD